MTCGKCREDKTEVSKNGLYCRACHAEYERGSRLVRKAVEHRRIAAATVSAYKRTIVEVFENIGEKEMNGYTAAMIARDIEL